MADLIEQLAYIYKTDSPADIKQRVKYVYYNKQRQRWFVRIPVDGKPKVFGEYRTHADAVRGKERALKWIKIKKEGVAHLIKGGGS